MKLRSTIAALHAALLAILLAASPALSGSMTLLGAGKAGGGGGGGSPTFALTDGTQVHQAPGFAATATFTGVNTGAGMVIIAVQYQDNAGLATGVTLNGSAMTRVSGGPAWVATANAIAELWYTPTLQSANASSTVVISAHGLAAAGIQAAVMTNLSSTTPSAAAFTAYSTGSASPYSVGPLNVPAGGFGVMGVWISPGSTGTASGALTIDNQVNDGNYDNIFGHVTAGASQTATITSGNFIGYVAAFAAWN